MKKVLSFKSFSLGVGRDTATCEHPEDTGKSGMRWGEWIKPQTSKGYYFRNNFLRPSYQKQSQASHLLF